MFGMWLRKEKRNLGGGGTPRRSSVSRENTLIYGCATAAASEIVSSFNLLYMTTNQDARLLFLLGVETTFFYVDGTLDVLSTKHIPSVDMCSFNIFYGCYIRRWERTTNSL